MVEHPRERKEFMQGAMRKPLSDQQDALSRRGSRKMQWTRDDHSQGSKIRKCCVKRTSKKRKSLKRQSVISNGGFFLGQVPQLPKAWGELIVGGHRSHQNRCHDHGSQGWEHRVEERSHQNRCHNHDSQDWEYRGEERSHLARRNAYLGLVLANNRHSHHHQAAGRCPQRLCLAH